MTKINDCCDIVDKLSSGSFPAETELEILLAGDDESSEYLYNTARQKADEVYGRAVYLRGLIEFSNYCKNDCYYCGIRRSNTSADRYRLSNDDIISCADSGYELGFRTVVLQSGEDTAFTDEDICFIVSEIKNRHPDIAITLSIGEKERESYAAYKNAGADRYLLRHETADRDHYGRLHPCVGTLSAGSGGGSGDQITSVGMSFDHRMNCLNDLKELGYQVGCGFMVGSPYQNIHCLYEDLVFIRDFKPHMVGIGPFLPQRDTPFADKPAGSAEMTLKLISVLRLLDPTLLLPATTALGTSDPKGREKGILAGANVIMPNLSPLNVRDKYILYDNKICTGEEAAECVHCLKKRISHLGYEVRESRGDHIGQCLDLT